MDSNEVALTPPLPPPEILEDFMTVLIVAFSYSPGAPRKLQSDQLYKELGEKVSKKIVGLCTKHFSDGIDEVDKIRFVKELFDTANKLLSGEIQP